MSAKHRVRENTNIHTVVGTTIFGIRTIITPFQCKTETQINLNDLEVNRFAVKVALLRNFTVLYYDILYTLQQMTNN